MAVLTYEGCEDKSWYYTSVEIVELPIKKNINLFLGAYREMHWHKPVEWALMTYGNARITAVDGDGNTTITFYTIKIRSLKLE